MTCTSTVFRFGPGFIAGVLPFGDQVGAGGVLRFSAQQLKARKKDDRLEQHHTGQQHRQFGEQAPALFRRRGRRRRRSPSCACAAALRFSFRFFRHAFFPVRPISAAQTRAGSPFIGKPSRELFRCISLPRQSVIGRRIIRA